MGLFSEARGHVKFVLPYFQFAAVVLTIALGAHNILKRFAAINPPITFELVTVQNSFVGGRARVDTAFRRNRVCPFVSWSPVVVDAEGVRYPVTTTVGSALTQGEGILRDRYFINLPDDMAVGRAVFEATITYACNSDLVPVIYPTNISFCVAPAGPQEHNPCKERDRHGVDAQ